MSFFQDMFSNNPTRAYITMLIIVHAVCAGDTTAKLLTLAHSDLDCRLYLPLSQLIITQFPCLTEHLTAFSLA